MLSSGIRKEAWDYLKWKHIVPIFDKHNNNNNNNHKTIKSIKITTTTTSTEIAKRNSKFTTNTTNNNINPLSNYQRYTKGLSKNKSLQILDSVKVHNFWGNIFRRKSQMHSYFSESAFGPQSDSKIEYRNLWRYRNTLRNTPLYQQQEKRRNK